MHQKDLRQLFSCHRGGTTFEKQQSTSGRLCSNLERGTGAPWVVFAKAADRQPMDSSTAQVQGCLNKSTCRTLLSMHVRGHL